MESDEGRRNADLTCPPGTGGDRSSSGMDGPACDPPGSQLLKWIGSKHRYARKIISCFPDRFNVYHEPFLGSGAILAALTPARGFGSDIFPPLIEIWKALKNDPGMLKEWYAFRWETMRRGEKIAEYEKIKASYNRNPNGADLLFLSRSCYGGVIRFRKSDGYMSTPVGVHSPISPVSFNARVDEWHRRMGGAEIELMDYRRAMGKARRGDLVYCDPPYAHSQGILYGAQDFKIGELFSEIERCKSRGVRVALSIDGTKKSGSHRCELPIPDGLFEREIFIDCGRSMLKRFRMEGESLESEGVRDRLLLTY